MKNYTVSKELSASAIKTEVKRFAEDTILTAFRSAGFTADRIRTDGANPTNEIGVVIGNITEDGKEYELCVTVNPTVKEYKDKKTAKRTTKGFSFKSAVEAYVKYLAEKADKAKETAKNKADKIARDTKARAKRAEEKAKAETEKAKV